MIVTFANITEPKMFASNANSALQERPQLTKYLYGSYAKRFIQEQCILKPGFRLYYAYSALCTRRKYLTFPGLFNLPLTGKLMKVQ